MAISKNNPIQRLRGFRKNWQDRVRVHLDQAGKKSSRRSARAAKASQQAPKPLDKLRPVVRCPTVKYNRRVRAGRGFTLEELKAAGVTSPAYARTVGIAVDHRRVNRSVEGFELNVQRLKEYLARLVVFPRKGAAKAAEGHSQLSVPVSFPVVNAKPEVTTKAVADVETKDAYHTLRMARSNKRFAGIREKRSRDKAEADK